MKDPNILKARLARAKIYQARLHVIREKIQSAKKLDEFMPTLETDLLMLCEAERISVYRCMRNGKELVSVFSSGSIANEIKLPLSASSIAGYVALSQKPLRIDNVYDEKPLQQIHPKLAFNKRFDMLHQFKSRSMIAVPIKRQYVLLGVLQLINCRENRCFQANDVARAEELARTLGEKFADEFQHTRGPFDDLLQKDKISSKHLLEIDARVKKHGGNLAKLIMTEARISAEDMGASLERYYQVPFMAFDNSIKLPAELTRTLNQAYLRNQGWVPILGDKEEATVLIDNPSDYNRIMEIERVLGVHKLVFRVGLQDDINRYIDSLNRTDKDQAGLSDIVDQMHADDNTETVVETTVTDDIESGANDHAIVQLVNQLIAEALTGDASDIHVEPGKEKEAATVRIRVDGLCRLIATVPANRVREVIARIKVMSGMDIANRRTPQDGKCKLHIRGQRIELRVATIPTVNGESCVLRILAAEGAMPMDKLNLTAANRENIERLIQHPHGLFLVVGPTGSGKTTTLHALLGFLNTPERKIWTAEDPVEITQTGLQQVQVSAKAGFTFASAMRAFLRADPDIILIGEMRDKETSHIGVEASLTGHLVLSTLHTNSAPETITRLLDLGLDPISFSDAFLGVLAQRLMRTLCPKCKQPQHASGREIEYLANTYGKEHFAELNIQPGEFEIYKPVGCKHCAESGYRGRTGIHEVLVSSEQIKKLIYNKSEAAILRQQAIADGMRTLLQDGVGKVIKGQSDTKQLHRVVAE